MFGKETGPETIWVERMKLVFTLLVSVETFQDVPVNTIGYSEAEITFRYLTLNNAETNIIEGEILVK